MSRIEQEVEFKASPHDVFEALMDEKKHAEFTGEEAKIVRKVGGSFSAYGGWIQGKTLKLVEDKLIVQEWWADDAAWPKGKRSKVTFALEAMNGGTKITFTHEDIPEGWKEQLEFGWTDFYWDPMKKFFK